MDDCRARRRACRWHAGTEVSVEEVDGITTWTGRFALLIPETGDSDSPQLEVKPLRATPTINVLVTTTGNQVYRQFKLELVASDRPGAAPVSRPPSSKR